jgi:HlyD family secretion protein
VSQTVKKLLILLVLLGAAIAAVAYWFAQPRSVAVGEEAFTLAPVEWESLTESVSATGLLQPEEVVAVGSEVSGKVVQIYPQADFNRTVAEGDPLLQLDERMARRSLHEAEAAVGAARTDVARAEAQRSAAELEVKRLGELVAMNVGMQKQLDVAELQLKAADAGVKAAQAKVEQALEAQRKAQLGVDLTTVRVPTRRDETAGPSAPKRQYVIIDRKVTVGQLIGPPASAQLFTLANDLGRMQVHAQVGESDITKVQPGLGASFTVYGYSEDEKRFQGRVVQIRPMPTSVQGAVFYDTVIDVANERDPKTEEWRLRPGMTAAVDINLRQHGPVWKVPTRALNFQLEEPYQTEAAKTKLARWQRRKDHDDWKPVWVLDGHKKPWPVFVRIGGKNAAGEPGLKDGQYNEVLEWDPELEPRPDPQNPAGMPQVIVDAPPAAKPGLFDRNLKLF